MAVAIVFIRQAPDVEVVVVKFVGFQTTPFKLRIVIVPAFAGLTCP